MPPALRPEKRVVAFAVLCLVAVAAAGLYIQWSRASRPDSPASIAIVNDGASLTRLLSQPHLLFRDTNLADHQGRLSIVALAAPQGDRFVTDLSCERVHYAAGRGVCLIADRGFTTSYRAVTFDGAFQRRHELPLPGIPSRVRVSPDGRRAGITVFVSGDSYAAGSFSTRTFVIDTETGENLGQLEEYAVTRDGERFSAIDFNFWGVTFADSRTIYATLASGGRTFLIEGDVDAKSARVIHEGVECPALSPDGTHVVFKKREMVQNRLVFRLHVLDLASGGVVATAERETVDDQAEWLDATSVLYGRPSSERPGSTDVWVVPADGSGVPRRLIGGAWSPAVVSAEATPPSGAGGA